MMLLKLRTSNGARPLTFFAVPGQESVKKKCLKPEEGPSGSPHATALEKGGGGGGGG